MWLSISPFVPDYLGSQGKSLIAFTMQCLLLWNSMEEVFHVYLNKLLIFYFSLYLVKNDFHGLV